ncbi:MAG TPA: AtpZ/AtpI family protein [Terriglobales bacterium]|nr:AtpZ/AtpI family protein [Terriglobales bacterium]
MIAAAVASANTGWLTSGSLVYRGGADLTLRGIFQADLSRLYGIVGRRRRTKKNQPSGQTSVHRQQSCYSVLRREVTSSLGRRMASDPQDPGKNNSWVQMANYAQLAIIFPAATVVGWLIGLALDHWLHTTWLYIVGLLLGIVAGFVELIRTATKNS